MRFKFLTNYYFKTLIFSLVAIIFLISSTVIGYKFSKGYFSDLEYTYFQIVDYIKGHISNFEQTIIKGLYETE